MGSATLSFLFSRATKVRGLLPRVLVDLYVILIFFSLGCSIFYIFCFYANFPRCCGWRMGDRHGGRSEVRAILAFRMTLHSTGSWVGKFSEKSCFRILPRPSNLFMMRWIDVRPLVRDFSDVSFSEFFLVGGGQVVVESGGFCRLSVAGGRLCNTRSLLSECLSPSPSDQGYMTWR